MPYKSDAQRKYFNAHRKEMEAQGVNVDEYNAASKGMSLPEHVAGAQMKAEKRATKRKTRAKKSKYDFLKRDKDKDQM